MQVFPFSFFFQCILVQGRDVGVQVRLSEEDTEYLRSGSFFGADGNRKSSVASNSSSSSSSAAGAVPTATVEVQTDPFLHDPSTFVSRLMATEQKALQMINKEREQFQLQMAELEAKAAARERELSSCIQDLRQEVAESERRNEEVRRAAAAKVSFFFFLSVCVVSFIIRSL